MPEVLNEETGKLMQVPDDPVAPADVPFEEPEPAAPDAEPDEDPDDEEAAEARAAIERDHEANEALEEQRRAEQAAQADAEKLMKALNRAAENYAKKIVDLLGGELEGWQACPLCAEGLPGFRVPVMPAPEHLAAVKIAIGEDPDPPLIGDGYSRECDKCAGLGVTASGSKVAAHARLTCLGCDGRGWVAVGHERESGSGASSPPTNGVAAPVPLPGEVASRPEVETLRQLGYIVVDPPTVPVVGPPTGDAPIPV